MPRDMNQIKDYVMSFRKILLVGHYTWRDLMALSYTIQLISQAPRGTSEWIKVTEWNLKHSWESKVVLFCISYSRSRCIVENFTSINPGKERR